jgi:hypothetical protein
MSAICVWYFHVRLLRRENFDTWSVSMNVAGSLVLLYVHFKHITLFEVSNYLKLSIYVQSFFLYSVLFQSNITTLLLLLLLLLLLTNQFRNKWSFLQIIYFDYCNILNCFLYVIFIITFLCSFICYLCILLKFLCCLCSWPYGVRASTLMIKEWM